VLSEDVPQQQQQVNMDEAAILASQMGMTVAELLGGADLPKAVVVGKYVHGKPLVSDKKLRQLPTHMQNLHAWYLLSSKREQTMLVAEVVEYYFREDEIHIDFLELFQLMNQDILDKSLMSCYCLSVVQFIVYKLFNYFTSLTCNYPYYIFLFSIMQNEDPGKYNDERIQYWVH
jgi:hypothetical protein